MDQQIKKHVILKNLDKYWTDIIRFVDIWDITVIAHGINSRMFQNRLENLPYVVPMIQKMPKRGLKIKELAFLCGMTVDEFTVKLCSDICPEYKGRIMNDDEFLITSWVEINKILWGVNNRMSRESHILLLNIWGEILSTSEGLDDAYKNGYLEINQNQKQN